MRGLLRKDLYCMKQNGKSLLFIFLVWGFIFLQSKSGGVAMVTMGMVVGAMQVTSIISYDHMAHWEEYALTMPLARGDVVRERYTLALLMPAAVGIFVAVVVAAAWAVRGNGLGGEFLAEIGYNLGIGMALAMLYAAIALPLTLWLGVEKARYIPSALFLILFFLLFGLVSYRSKIPDAAPDILGLTLHSLVTGAAIAAAIGYAVSYGVSLRVYGRREF